MIVLRDAGGVSRTLSVSDTWFTARPGSPTPAHPLEGQNDNPGTAAA